MKKIFLAMLALVSVLAVSCNKDKDGESEIVGKWQLVSKTQNGNPVQLNECDLLATYEFFADGRMINSDYCGNSGGGTFSFTYVFEGENLTLTTPGNVVSNATAVITGDLLTITTSSESSGVEVMTGKRI